MFFIYLRRELRRRWRQAFVVTAGFTLGIGLVITVTAASAGVQNAQNTVLHSLYGLGTDVTVSQAVVPGEGGAPAGPGSGVAWPQPGTKLDFARLIANLSLGTLGQSAAGTIARLNHVSASAGALTLSNIRITGTMPYPGQGLSTVTPSTTSVDGVDLAPNARSVGPLASGQISSGRAFTPADSNSKVAIVSSGYAKSSSLSVGSNVYVGSTPGTSSAFKVIGIVNEPPGSAAANFYIPLQQAQTRSGVPGKVNMIYVAVASAADVSAVQNAIQRLYPGATVATSGNLAKQVTGSLSSAASLATRLGTWLAIAVLAAAFALASLFTLSSVARRVRDFGTLKALGWRGRRIIGQVMGESLVQGIAGALLGTGLGVIAATVVSQVAPPLSATLGNYNPNATPPPSGAGSQVSNARNAVNSSAHTLSVHLNAPVTIGTVVLAAALAVAGGLIAGSIGGWRASRLVPAAAIARVE
jgi:putative ABC transport system permease protein